METINKLLFVILILPAYTTPPMKMELTERSETSAHKIQKPGKHPKEIIQHSEHGESFKSRNILICRAIGV